MQRNAGTSPRMQTILLIACVAMLSVAPAAAESGWLAGLNAGQAKLQDFRLATTTFDDTDTVWTAWGGYQFGNYFALAGGYLDLGKYHAEGPAFGGFVQDIEVDGFHLFGMGFWPLSTRVSLFGTLGAYWWDYSFQDTDAFITGVRRLSDKGVSPTFGLGFNFAVGESRAWNLNIAWQRFVKVGNRNTVEHENDYDLILAGVAYHFGKRR